MIKKSNHKLIPLAFLFCFSFSFSQSNVPPNIDAIGDQYYCPLSQINVATNFNIIDPDDTEVEALHIQISTGYILNEDSLVLTGTHSNIVATWNNSEGKLSLRGVANAPVSYVDIITAVNDVVFQSSSVAVLGEKHFSFTIGDANYLPSTGHFYEYIPNLGITWSNARTLAETFSYFGLQGYLATITSPEEAQLSGEQAAGAGWIGGSDEQTEGVWRWMTGPEAGTIFWNGGSNGSTPNYANWNTNEPNDLGGEDYAHVTAPGIGVDGSWNDLDVDGDPDSGSNYHPQGFIVEYGGTPGDPVVDISASTKITVPSVIGIFPASSCGPSSLILGATPSAGTIVWFDAVSGGSQLGTGNSFTTPLINSTTSYFVLVSVNGCLEGVRQQVTATINPVPQITSFTEENVCENGSANISATPSEGTVNWYTTNLGGTPIATGITFVTPNINVTTTYFAEAVSSNGCISVARTPITATVIYTGIPSGNTSQTFCSSQLATIADLSITGTDIKWYDAATGGNLLDDSDELISSTYYATQTINGCEGASLSLDVTIIPGPEFEFDDTSIYCLEGNPITLQTYNPSGNYSYLWTDELGTVISAGTMATVNSGGIYTVVATSLATGCSSFPETFNVVESSIAEIDIDDVTVLDLVNTNSISINNENNNLGIGDYEFSLDNEFGWYQDEPVFSNVSSGVHYLYVKDKNGCGITPALEIFVLGFPKFFTPNGDTVNDTWNLKGWSNTYALNSSIHIYDRYGKLIKQISPASLGWNGTFNGSNLKSDDFWFVAELIELDGTTRSLRGHFSLVR